MPTVRNTLLAAAGWCVFGGLGATEPAGKPPMSGQPQAAQPQVSGQPPVSADHAAKMERGLKLFREQVQGVFVARCVECHSPELAESEFDLTTRERLLKGGIQGAAVVPGNAKTSLLAALVSHRKQPAMPHDGTKLSAAEIAAIEAWIDCGAPYDGPLGGAKAPSADWTAKRIDPALKEFWSFRRLTDPPRPTLDPPGPVGEIDRYLEAARRKVGLKAVGPAPKEVLLRRAYLDLWGLPPSPADVAAFLADDSPHAFERVVDRLLASPRYGERYGRYWLDIARFAESHGFEHDYDRPSAYHYRNFVIRAFTEDLPYDRFVRNQIAGDELEPENISALAATGFLGAGVHSTQITKNEVEKHRYDELDDMLATTGTAFLGLTMGCCRCHDHKYDPLPQADYYTMLSTFTTTVRAEPALDFDPAGYRRKLDAHQKRLAPLEEALARYDATELPEKFRAWETAQAGDEAQPKGKPSWLLLPVAEIRSQGKAEFKPQADGSYLVQGKNPDQDVWTVSTQPVGPVARLRLECLADPTLPHHGPGRAGNGNFALTTLKVHIVSADGKTRRPEPLAAEAATFEQKGLPAAATVDADATSGWAVDPQFGKSHAIVFRPENPLVLGPGERLELRLEFKNNKQHGIGRPRFSFAGPDGSGELTAPPLAADVQAALAKPSAERNPAETRVLLAWFGLRDEGRKALAAKLDAARKAAPQPDLRKVLVCSEGLPAIRLHTQGDDFLKETHFLRRGEVNQKQGVAPVRFLQILTAEGTSPDAWVKPMPAGSKTSGRRKALAEWLTDVERGAGGLTARVIVNRLWQFHFGRGIVATPSDFGTRGAPPSHPELLDRLAVKLIQGGWKLKTLHREIMLSEAYRADHAYDPAGAKLDRDNAYHWRFAPRRLEAEAIRDSLLAVSGKLETHDGGFGPGTLDESRPCRSIYLTVKRSRLIPMLQVFDAPDALQGVGDRPRTTVAPQALVFMNHPLVGKAAEGLAQVASRGDDEAGSFIDRAFVQALSRKPTAEERTASLEFLTAQEAEYAARGPAAATKLARTDFCRSLLCHNEFVYLP